jgi:hypothetical protein
VAKIETRPAVEEFERILHVADAAMVARGDLGVELPMEEIPLVQKRLLRAARASGRPVIVATQMLESMVRSPRPTRAEANDVATAVLDGADAIMLSGETAIGDFPFEAASVATRVARVVESHGAEYRAAQPPCLHTGEAAAVAHAAASIVEGDSEVIAITCFTTTGRTAALLSAERPRVPIHAFIPEAGIRRANGLLWGVETHPATRPDDTDAMISMMDRRPGLGGRHRGDGGLDARRADDHQHAEDPSGRLDGSVMGKNAPLRAAVPPRSVALWRCDPRTRSPAGRRACSCPPTATTSTSPRRPSSGGSRSSGAAGTLPGGGGCSA